MVNIKMQRSNESKSFFEMIARLRRTGTIARPFFLVSFLFSAGFSALIVAQDCQPISKSYQKAVVSIVATKEVIETGAVSTSYGTGFIISPEGYVLTAFHVVASDQTLDRISIRASIGSFFAPSTDLKLIKSDPESDIAILKLMDDSQLRTALPLGCPWKMQQGDKLCSIGYIGELKQGPESSSGAIRTRNGDNNRWLVDMPSNKGESGAPVFDASGKVVAIKYGGYSPSELQNVNLVTPINLAETMAKMYAGITIPSCDLPSTAPQTSLTIQKVSGDQMTIPLGGWKEFLVKVTDANGQPVPGVKIAWQTPVGGHLVYIGETDKDGQSSATNLYTFPNPSSYVQIATIVNKEVAKGFTDLEKIALTGPTVAFVYYQK